jgi:hypothetical protein
VQAGIKEPETFEVAAWLAPQMGPDRVSDMLASISRNSLRSYSARVFKESGLKIKRFQWKDGFLPAHPFLKKEDGSPVELHLVPAEILSSSVAARTDLQQLTADLRRIVLRTFNPKNAPRADKYKQKAIEELLRRPERARQIIGHLRKMGAAPYDLAKDPLGIYLWYFLGSTLAERVEITGNPQTTLQIARQACQWFAHEVEHRATWKDLYSDSRARPESFAQHEFAKAVRQILEEHGFHISREPDVGRGKPDFVIVKEREGTIIEIKLTHNTRLSHARKQLQAYMEAWPGASGILLVIHVDGRNTEQIKNRFLEGERAIAHPRPDLEVIMVDGTQKKIPARL